jgi:lipid II:glycine glycyltransferase (peptidoglycan interpeptide bridge formation enzyme)
MTAKEKYRLFCQTEQELPLFVQDWYLDAVCQDGFWDVALVEKKDRILASLPFFVKKKLGFTYITMPPMVKTMGPYLIPEVRELKNSHRFYQQLIDQLPKVDGFKQDFHPALTNWLPFYWKGYQQTTRYTYTLDVTNLDQVYDELNRNMKRNIKKAAAQLSIETHHSLDTFYRINQMSFDRQGVNIPYSFNFLQKHDRALEKNNARQMLFAVDEQGRIHSAAYLVWDKTTAYYHLSGDDPELRNSGAGILLIWEAIKYTHEQLRLPRFDFEGSMIENIEAIRRQFGARQEPYFRVWKYHSLFYKWLDWKWRRSI